MSKVINTTSTPIYDYIILLTLFISQIFLIILIFFYLISSFNLVQPTIIDRIFLFSVLLTLIAISYFVIKAILIALKYFFSHEECFCENGKFYYRKILFNWIKLRVFYLPVQDIISIEDLGKRIIEPGKNTAVNYFKQNERILIKLTSGVEYKIWNYVRRPKLFSIDNSFDKDSDFFLALNKIKEIITKEKLNQKIKRLEDIYYSIVDKRYECILNKIIEEKILFITKMEEKIIINGYREAIENLEIFKNMEWEEINFYNFYVDYLSKKENKDKIVLVGYNGIDGKEVTMSILKDDINEIRDSKSTFKD
ncbi:MAG: hypothetical protein SOY60_06700 [Fusobacterium gastrosuis]|uniref:hypothetical protein n=1 Tax=Fusobacterium gastrosuis TaxID=1755100 RepID=UPI002A8AB974|nr:hypothetical protein [Fusobacterium gastrosuis]